ncbi:hypothetical protein FW778_02000 [Ginsengibacter hankyongi]|uniref:Uncharacterized protein n=1 Tax=Ginsengibacter hankyongi TaxID=2607284 RepID=A0A5J5IL86_9BACT|nr:hypothetical protein [Ginsengibacter hankyongi]KAA9040837.1 hypothetical protein FW778_02000 [Ginsengibacter hankyongi]
MADQIEFISDDKRIRFNKQKTMPQRLSTILNVSAKILDKKGVFNAFVDIDSKLYIDPSLLAKVKIKEFKNSYSKFKTYFSEVLNIVDNSKNRNDRFWREANMRLQFKEFKYVALGYSVGNRSGNAIGREIAANLLDTSHQIIKAGIKDPIIFELIGLFEKGIGADRISDMTIHIIKDDLIKYTQRVSDELGIKQNEFGISKIKLPFNPKTREPIVFTPKELLQDLPIAFCWDDIDRVCQENSDLRNKVNKEIGKTWKFATSSKVAKAKLKQTLLTNPEALKDLINQYSQKPRTPYDFVNDPSGQVIWAELSEKAVNDFPLNFASLNLKPVNSENILLVTKTICERYAKLIESNGWFEFLYDNSGKLRNERFAQKLFYGIADQYCLANDLNLSREPNAGSGALDFKITKGYKAVVTVEIKYSSNTNLIKGYTKQLPTYNKAESAEKSIYLVLQTTKTNNTIRRLHKINRASIDKHERIPEVIIIDARRQKSASQRR